jgi:hypothetical protein
MRNIVIEYEIKKRRIGFKRSRSKSVEDEYSDLVPKEISKARKFSSNDSFIKKKTKRERSESLFEVTELEDGEIDENDSRKKKCFSANFDADLNVEEINKMISNIHINDENKEMLRRLQSDVPSVRNRKEKLIDKSYLAFHLQRIDLKSLKESVGDFKLNLILDIDSTILFAENDDRIGVDKLDEDVHYITYFEPSVNREYSLKFKIRKHIVEFLQSVSQICNIYVSTHAQLAYAKEVLSIIAKKSNVDIDLDNIKARTPLDVSMNNINAKTLNM